MTKPWNEDPLAYLEAATRRLAPLGVKRLRLVDSGFEMEFYEHAPALLDPNKGGPEKPRRSDDEDPDSEEELMERTPPADPFKDGVLFGSTRVPGYARRPAGARNDDDLDE